MKKKKKTQRTFCENLLTHVSIMTKRIFSKLECSFPCVETKFGAILMRHHEAMDVWKSWLCCSCQYAYSICACPVVLGRMTQYCVSWYPCIHDMQLLGTVKSLKYLKMCCSHIQNVLTLTTIVKQIDLWISSMHCFPSLMPLLKFLLELVSRVAHTKFKISSKLFLKTLS